MNTGYEQQAAAVGDGGGDGEEETSGGQVQQVQNSENGFDSMCDKDG